MSCYLSSVSGPGGKEARWRSNILIFSTLRLKSILKRVTLPIGGLQDGAFGNVKFDTLMIIVMYMSKPLISPGASFVPSQVQQRKKQETKG